MDTGDHGPGGGFRLPMLRDQQRAHRRATGPYIGTDWTGVQWKSSGGQCWSSAGGIVAVGAEDDRPIVDALIAIGFHIFRSWDKSLLRCGGDERRKCIERVRRQSRVSDEAMSVCVVIAVVISQGLDDFTMNDALGSEVGPYRW